MPAPHTRSEVLARRARTIPTVFALLLVVIAALPLLAAGAVLLDAGRWILRRRPWMSTRLLAFGLLYLAAEAAGILALGAVWAVTGGGRLRTRYIDATYAVQAWWTSALVFGVTVIFSLRFHVEGEEAIGPGPIILLARHASIIDNLLPAQFVTRRHGIRLRYVLKQELLSDPCLDIAGTRLPNYFVDRRAENPRRELAAIQALAADLTPHDGVLIFPEGTRFTPSRRERALTDLRTSASGFVERAEQLRHVLPPKLGGVSSILKAAPDADIVVLGHRGLEGFARIGDLWRGGMVGRTVQLRFWRVPAADVPSGRQARAAWLFDQWLRIDRWIGEASGQPA